MSKLQSEHTIPYANDMFIPRIKYPHQNVPMQSEKKVGPEGLRIWQILRPSVVPIMVEHVYPTHGQFADWELGGTAPAYIQNTDVKV